MSNGFVNHVLVDFENVAQLDFSGFGERLIKLTLLLGKTQTRIDTHLVTQLLAHAADVRIVQLRSTGKNAVDFALTYYLGRATSSDPTGFFHIISKDTGFDPLVEHLRAQHVKLTRHENFASCLAQITKCATRDLTAAKPTPAAPAPISPPAAVGNSAPRQASIDEIWEYITSNGSNQPKKRTTLASHLRTHYHWSDEQYVKSVIDQLVARKHIAISDTGKVTYSVKASSAETPR